MDTRFFSEKKSLPKNVEEFNHVEHLENLIQLMEQSSIKPSNEDDDKNANNQLEFARESLRLLKKIISVPELNILEKKSVAVELCGINNKFFGKNEIPLIQGEKSKMFAALLAQHFRHLEKIPFSEAEINLSIIFSKIPFINLRSIPDQIKHHIILADRIDEQMLEYAKNSNAPKNKMASLV